MIYKPLKHQTYGTQQIIDLPEVGPFLDMGLGKTVMTLTGVDFLLKNKQVRRPLVVAPKKVAENVWTDEIEKWEHLNHLKASKILGTEKDRKKALAAKADIYIINRENIVWLVALLGSNWNFDMLIIDELSSFKSPDAQRFKALKLIRSYVHRCVGLTGTPAPNGLLGLWSQLYLLDKGERLGDKYTAYRSTYFDAGQRDGYAVYNYTLKKGNAFLGDDFYKMEILNKIKDICFSMRTEDYIDLPERIDNDRYISLSKEAWARYEAFEEEAVLELIDKDITAVNAAALTNKLQQYANGAVYDEFKNFHQIHDEKLDALKEIVETLDGEPVLVFYLFKSDKERIMKAIKGVRELKTPKDIADWNAGLIPVCIAHPASTGHGLNLQFGGFNMCWFGCPWSLELYQQAVKRIHRNGVKRAVNNIRLIIRGTIDETVIKRLSGKETLQDSVIAAVKALIKKYKKN